MRVTLPATLPYTGVIDTFAATQLTIMLGKEHCVTEIFQRSRMEHGAGRVTRRAVLAGVAAACSSILLAACGGEGATETSKPASSVAPTSAPASSIASTVAPAAPSAPATSATPAATTAPTLAPAATAGGKTTQLTFVHWYPQMDHPMAQVIKAYNDKQTAVKITPQIETDYTAILQKVQAGLAAGNPPALATVGWNLKYAANALNLVPMETIGGDTLATVLGRFQKEFLAAAAVGGKTIGLPYATSNPVVYVNTDIVTKAGLDPNAVPKTWDAMVAFGKTIKDKTGIVPFALESTSWLEEAFIASAGGRLLDESGKPAFDTPEAAAGIAAQAKAFAGGLSPYQISGDASNSFEAGTAAIHFDSIFRLSGHRAATKANFIVTPFPTVVEGKPTKLPTGGNFLGVFAKDADQRKAAWDFLSYATSDEGMAIWIKTGYISPTNGKFDIPKGQEVAYAQVPNAFPWTAWPGAKSVEANKAFQDNMQKALTGAASPQDALKSAKTEVAALLA